MQDILTLAIPQPAMSDQLQLAEHDAVAVPDCLDYTLQRFTYEKPLPVEDVAMVVYQPAKRGQSAAVELRYCVAGSKYCQNPSCTDQLCSEGKGNCNERIPSVDIITVRFQPAFIQSLQKGATSTSAPLFELQSRKPFMKTIQPCTKSKSVLEQMVHHNYEGALKNIFLQSKALELLLFSSDQFIQNDPDERYGCRFLTQLEDREKIEKARGILLEQLDAPITIRDLARRVAMNECYLKKGFKAMYGTTIYDYFQKERMEKAKSLLYEKGMSVSEVAILMGYSCISHFSTAFKKHTGLKPCELLLR
ncbi:AraC family transcriptional regulator [Chitinophaga pendula]|uniref:helix-turn-helix domain-containing protein n=1 Tax=Chitinophaga TaxID=79328 RepID=UPI000BAF19B5|nr:MULTISPECIES: AraC family transcriptional regulator [Chitinophaga]ASZ10010.1 AraC family transcriptional regulator [Chitinophaga sp. MD30]UCJ07044.1 AraC family transcriptional regulator [Chitinophaga pendula]